MPRERGHRGREKREDLAIIIPAFGVIFLVPLVANLFVVRERLFGVPLEIVYLFGVWLFLVAGAVGLSFWLPAVGSSSGSDEDDRGKRSGPA
jgi:hypothetical protein